MIPPDTHLQIGSLLFEGLDQSIRASPELIPEEGSPPGFDIA